MGRVTEIDRRLGAAVRRAAARPPGGTWAARLAAHALSPGFRAVVAAMIARRATRPAGVRALAAGVAAAMTARALRDRVGRTRPGARTEGGFPSRHAAAAAAIAGTVARRHARLGRALAVCAAVGLAGRVAVAEHEPADIAAGAGLGIAVAAVLARAPGDRVP